MTASEDVQIPPAQVLFIAHAFPPSAEVGGQRVARLCKYLPEHGFHPIVLTTAEEFMAERDDTFPNDSNGCTVIRTPVSATPLTLYRKWKSKLASNRSQPDGRPHAGTELPAERTGLHKHLLVALQTPDAEHGWYRPALRAGARLLAQQEIAVIFSSGPPWTCHLVAKELKKKFGVPWIADFRDPWAGNPQMPAWRSFIDGRLEKACVRNADHVLCNTDSLRALLLKRYPALDPAKFSTLTNGFDDPVIAIDPNPGNSSTKLLLHAGAIYGLRRIDTFCQALQALVDKGKINPQTLKVLFLGDMDYDLAQAARQQAPRLFESTVQIQPRVNWIEARRAMAAADLLLLFQGGHVKQIPAKFYDYLEIGRPILALTKPGALTEVMDRIGAGIWADSDSPNDIAAKLAQALELPRAVPLQLRQKWEQEFHFRILTAKLAQHIRQLLLTRKPTL